MKILDLLKSNKYYRIFVLLIITIFSVFAIFIDVNLLINGLTNFSISFRSSFLTIFIVGILLYKLYDNFYLKKTNEKLPIKIIAILFALLMIFGNSYEELNNWNLIFGSRQLLLLSIFIFIGYYLLFNCLINKLFSIIYNYASLKNFKSNKVFKFIFEDHPFLTVFIIMLICWLPYIISFYPGILSPDPSNQIKQFFGLNTHYATDVLLVDKSVLITNHHPVLHTFLLGSCVKFGHIIGSDNLGIFLCSSIQIITLLSVLSYTIVYMKKLRTPMCIRIVALLIYSLVPVFPFYAMSLVKDTIFTSLVILYVIMLFEYVRKANKKKIKVKKAFLSILLLLGLMLFRNNGVFMVVLSFPFLFLIDKKNRLRLSGIFFIAIILFESFLNVILPANKITLGSVREALSVPFQQTARYVNYYGDELSTTDKRIIDKVLGYDTLASRYNPVLADPVKNKFNPKTSYNNLKDYFKVWYAGLNKYPLIYIEATINNSYGYFYPNTTNWYLYFNYDSRLKKTGLFNYHYNKFSNARTFLSSYGVIFPYIPIIGMLVNIGFNTWVILMLATFIIVLKKYKYLIYLSPLIALILMCIVSPANTYFRYAMPYIFSIPIAISMFINVIINNEKNRKEKLWKIIE